MIAEGRSLAEVDAFVRQFAERAERWHEQPGDLADGPAEPWTDPDHPDERLDVAYRGGIVPATQRGGGDGWDAITVLRARGRRLAKRIGRDGSIEAYDSVKHFDLVEIPVDGLNHLEEELHRLLRQPDRCVVRGRIADLGRTRGVRRLLYPEGDDPASLVDVPRRWLALDVDSLPLPSNIRREDIVACAKVATAALPAEFHGARCIAQATASHGIKPGMRLRLWFWLDRPVSGAALKRWLAGAPVDHSLFGSAQPIFTAGPVFDRRRDPLPNRIARLPGPPRVAVPALPEPEPRPAAKPVNIRPAIGLSRYAEAALDGAWRRIAQAREGERDKAINSEAYSIGRLAGGGAIPPALAVRVLHHAVAQIPGAGPREVSKVDRSFNDGLRQPRGAPRE